MHLVGGQRQGFFQLVESMYRYKIAADSKYARILSQKCVLILRVQERLFGKHPEEFEESLIEIGKIGKAVQGSYYKAYTIS